MDCHRCSLRGVSNLWRNEWWAQSCLYQVSALRFYTKLQWLMSITFVLGYWRRLICTIFCRWHFGIDFLSQHCHNSELAPDQTIIGKIFISIQKNVWNCVKSHSGLEGQPTCITSEVYSLIRKEEKYRTQSSTEPFNLRTQKLFKKLRNMAAVKIKTVKT